MKTCLLLTGAALMSLVILVERVVRYALFRLLCWLP